jgi:putative oxidoreductase
MEKTTEVKDMLVDVGILLIRVLFGAAMAAHGAQKLLGWFGGYGLKGTGGFFEGLGFRPGTAFAAAAGFSEMGGGTLLTLGLLTPFGAAAVLSAMLVAMVSVHVKNGFFAMVNGIEMPFLYAAAALGLAFTGAGAFSLDALLGLTFLSQPRLVGGILVLAVIGAAVTLATRRQPQGQASAAHS